MSPLHRAFCCLALCLHLGSHAYSQEVPPYLFTVEGTTVETLKAVFVPLVELDQSTPESVVAAYAALTDGRASAVDHGREAQARIDAAIRRSLEPLETALLTADARWFLDLEREKMRPELAAIQRIAGATEIVKIERHEDLAYVETSQRVISGKLIEAPDQWDIREEHISRLFTCVAVDGRWFVETVAQSEPDPSAPADDPGVVWGPPQSSPLELYYVWTIAARPEPTATAPAHTPEEAALAVFEVLQPRVTRLGIESLLRTTADHMLAIESLIAPAIVAEEWQYASEVAEQLDAERPYLRRRVIKTVELGDDAATITLEPAPGAAAPVITGATTIRVRKNGDVWLVDQAGYDVESFLGKTYVDSPNIYQLQ